MAIWEPTAVVNICLGELLLLLLLLLVVGAVVVAVGNHCDILPGPHNHQAHI